MVHEGTVSASGHCVIVGGSQSEQLSLIALFVFPQLFSCHNFSSWYFTVFLHVPQTSACQDIKCTLFVLFQKLLSSLDQFCADEETVLDCCESGVKQTQATPQFRREIMFPEIWRSSVWDVYVRTCELIGEVSSVHTATSISPSVEACGAGGAGAMVTDPSEKQLNANRKSLMSEHKFFSYLPSFSL